MKTLIAFFAALALALALSGCSQIKAGKIIDGIDTAMDIAKTVCTVADVFVDNAPPAVEKCGEYLNKAAEIRQDDRVLAFVQVARCVESNREDRAKMLQCIDDIDGWKIILEELK